MSAVPFSYATDEKQLQTGKAKKYVKSLVCMQIFCIFLKLQNLNSPPRSPLRIIFCYQNPICLNILFFCKVPQACDVFYKLNHGCMTTLLPPLSSLLHCFLFKKHIKALEIMSWIITDAFRCCGTKLASVLSLC